MTILAKSDTRLVARVSPELHQMVNKAASLTGASITQFLIEAVTEKATNIIDEMSLIHLSNKDTLAVFKALESPTPPTEELEVLWLNYKKSDLFDAETTEFN